MKPKSAPWPQSRRKDIGEELKAYFQELVDREDIPPCPAALINGFRSERASRPSREPRLPYLAAAAALLLLFASGIPPKHSYGAHDLENGAARLFTDPELRSAIADRLGDLRSWTGKSLLKE